MIKSRIFVASAVAALALVGVTAGTSSAAPVRPNLPLPTVNDWANHGFTGEAESIWVEPGACYHTLISGGFASTQNLTGRQVAVFSSGWCDGDEWVVNPGDATDIPFFAHSVSIVG